MNKKQKFDKYWHYLHSVQSPGVDVRFMRKCYRELKNKEPYLFREDFCFTFAISCEWVKLGKRYQSISVDIDKVPLEYGQKNYLPLLKPEQQKRIKIVHSNVLNYRAVTKVDIISATNFSYCSLKKRSDMKKYFQKCLRALKPGGLLVLDCFGGSECYSTREEKVNCGNFTYYWDQYYFDPITHDTRFYIHYKRRGERKRHKVFKYEWRFWTMPEIRDMLQEVGFKKSHVYWEGSTREGEGNGIFTRRARGEDCESWIAYIIAEK